MLSLQLQLSNKGCIISSTAFTSKVFAGDSNSTFNKYEAMLCASVNTFILLLLNTTIQVFPICKGEVKHKHYCVMYYSIAIIKMVFYERTALIFSCLQYLVRKCFKLIIHYYCLVKLDSFYGYNYLIIS